MTLPLQLALGLGLSTGIGLLAYRRRSLSKSGVLGAMLTGTLTFGLGGLIWGMSLIFFFISSSFFSHYREVEKASVAADKFSKGGQRDFRQALANGGVATVIAVLYALLGFPEALFAAYTGALAAATADTWATELGTLSHQTPRLITTGQPVAPGTSGGVTVLGTLAASGGGGSLGLFAAALALLTRTVPLLRGARPGAREQESAGLLWLAPIGLMSGLAGSLFDSLLGATLQVMFYCPTCNKETEKRLHTCNTPTTYLRGWRWVDNDVVNFSSGIVGALVGWGCYVLLTRVGRKVDLCHNALDVCRRAGAASSARPRRCARRGHDAHIGATVTVF